MKVPADLKRNNLKRKLVLWLLLPLLTMFFLRAAYTFFVISNEMPNRVYDRALLGMANALAQQVVFSDGQVSVDLPRAAMQVLSWDEYDQIFFSVRDNRGRFIAGNKRLPPHPDAPEVLDKPVYYDTRIDGKRVRAVGIHVPFPRQANGQYIVVEVAETINKRKMLGQEILSSSLIPQAAIILLGTLAVLIGITFGLKPLKQLQQQISQRHHRDLSPVDEWLAPEEVRPLMHAINDLMQRLGMALETQNRFTADAAHQLRTPVAGLKAQLELALRQESTEEIKASLRLAATSLDRMSRLVNQLLVLARSENAVQNLENEQHFDLGKAASETTMEWVPTALQHNIDLGFDEADTPLPIRGNPYPLKEMLSNLIDNAIRYSPAGSRVTVRVRQEGDSPLLGVEDTGIGIPASERERIFERFYRVLGSQADGSGLGLAIVQEIARSYGATVSVQEGARGKGTVFLVRFPPLMSAPA